MNFTAEHGRDVCSNQSGGLPLSNKMILQSATDRGGKSALDEFLPELDARRESREARIDPGEIDLDTIGLRIEPAAAHRAAAATDPGAQLWPMLAAALVGVGVAILAFSAFARLGHF